MVSVQELERLKAIVSLVALLQKSQRLAEPGDAGFQRSPVILVQDP
ncbi:MAG: hypothetical protein ACI8P0_003364 [Planctomycetaceae bacterium]|jgi:hypothetical protein